MKKLILIVMLFAGMQSYAQSKPEPIRYRYTPLINEVEIKGKITEKFTAMKDGNPVMFVTVDKVMIAIWEEPLYKKFKVGDKFKFVGLVPLRWTPEVVKPDTVPVPPAEATAVASNN